MKQYYFLAGFPRSGNTLLSSILNQNPEIYSSPLSPINSVMWNFEQTNDINEHIKINSKSNLDKILKNIMNNYYEDINEPIIIDREKMWATSGNINLIKKYITKDPKIIFTVRPILEILTSFINILPEHSYIDIEMEQKGWWYKDYLSKNDNRCDYLMRPFGQIDQALLSINEILKHENKNIIYLVKYDDIVYNPEKTFKNIYDFLNIPYYAHNFNNIKKVENYNDAILGMPDNLHNVRPKLNKISKDPKEILSDYIINKYKNIGWELK